MKPNFALSLSFDGIRLLYRGADGWHQLGHVELDHPDIDAALVDLRTRAQALNMGEVATKVLIPNDQIKYLALDTTRTNDRDVREALDGATPYDVDELVYDFVHGGGRTYIAAVARETLDEAEAFAASHKMAPICFAAIPEPFTYVGEAYFGASKGAAALLNGQGLPERDRAAVEIIPVPLPDPAIVNELDAQLAEPVDASPEVLRAEMAELQTLDLGTDGVDTPDFDPEPDHIDTPVTTEEAIEIAAEAPQNDSEMPVFSARARPEDAAPPLQLPVEPEPVEPVEIDAPPSSDIESAPEIPVFGSTRDKTLAADRRDFDTPARASKSSPQRWTTAPTASARVEPQVSAPPVMPAAIPAAPAPTAPIDHGSIPEAIGPAVTAELDDQDAPAGPAITGLSDAALPEEHAPQGPTADIAASLAATLAPSPDEAPLPTPLVAEARTPSPAEPARRGGLFRSRRQPVPTPTEDPQTAPAAQSTDTQDASNFGARKAKRPPRQIGGKPRFLGVILTILLLLFLAAVAAFASFTEDGLAGLFKRNTPDTTVAQTPEITTTTPEQTIVATTIAPETPLPDTTPLAANSAPIVGQILSPAEAQRIYAVTGVWQRAPRMPLTPRTTSIEGLQTALADEPHFARPAPGIPRAASAVTDVAMGTVAPPPPPGTFYPRDTRGFLLATEDGIQTPDGMMIYAGSPSKRPPTAFFDGVVTPVVEGNIEAVIAAPVAPVDVPAVTTAPVAPAIDVARLAAFRPAARPEAITARFAAPAPVVPTVPAAPQIVTDPEFAALAAFRPRQRPDAIAPAVVAAIAAAVPPAIDPALVAFRPRLRPQNLAPAAPVIAQPVPAQPTTQDVANAQLAAAIQGAVAEAASAAPPANPFADATVQAVTASMRPDIRPRNFSRVVAQQQAAAQQVSAAQPARSVPSSGPTATSVAAAATMDNAINLRRINLIGVYGGDSNRRALVRLANGRYIKVSVGDRLDGGQVAAIGDTFITYTNRGRTERLEMPSG